MSLGLKQLNAQGIELSTLNVSPLAYNTLNLDVSIQAWVTAYGACLRL